MDLVSARPGFLRKCPEEMCEEEWWQLASREWVGCGGLEKERVNYGGVVLQVLVS